MPPAGKGSLGRPPCSMAADLAWTTCQALPWRPQQTRSLVHPRGSGSQLIKSPDTGEGARGWLYDFPKPSSGQWQRCWPMQINIQRTSDGGRCTNRKIWEGGWEAFNLTQEMGKVETQVLLEFPKIRECLSWRTNGKARPRPSSYRAGNYRQEK